MNRTNLTILFLFVINCASFGQNASENKLLEAYDNIVGIENTGLYNGTEFKDPFLNTDGTFRYYNGFNYTKGSVTYNDQTYSSVLLKYDLLEDKLLTQSDDNLGLFNVTLIPEKVSAFSIYGHHFVRLTDTNTGFSGNGFFEIAFNGNDLTLFIKHIKKKKDKALKSGVQYRFKNDNFYLLKTKANYFVLNSVKDVRKALPENEEQIRDFHKSYRKLSRSNPDAYMIKLIKYLDGITTPPKP